jgi:hypothetical protein
VETWLDPTQNVDQGSRENQISMNWETMILGLGWGSVMTAAMWGIGGITRFKTWPEGPAWGTAVLGVAIFTWIGGVLDSMGGASRTMLTGTILIGLAAAALQLTRRKPPMKEINWTQTGAIIIAAAGSFMIWGTWFSQENANWDDTTGYIPTCHQMAEYGRSWAPLAVRRAYTWGGQYPLQVTGMLFTQDHGAYIYERVLGTWILVGIGLQTAKRAGGWKGTTIGWLITAVPQININCAPNILVTALLIGAWENRKTSTLMAMLLGCACAMRFQAIPPAAAIGLWAWKESGWKWQFATTGATTGLLYLLPFWWNHYDQFKTILPNLWPGTLSREHLEFVQSWPQTIENITRMATHSAGPLIVGGAMLGGRNNKALAAIGIGTLIYMTLSLPEFSQLEWKRYAWPTLAAMAIVGARRWSTGNPMAALLALTCLIGPPLEQTEKFWTKTRKVPQWDIWETRKAIINNTEENTRVATWVFQTNLLDFQRNTIIVLDDFPLVGNPPEDGNPEAWKQWAKKQGIEILCHLDFNARRGPLSVREILTRASGPHTNLKHYQRVWWPKRKVMMKALEELREKIPSRQDGPFIFLDLREQTHE